MIIIHTTNTEHPIDLFMEVKTSMGQMVQQRSKRTRVFSRERWQNRKWQNRALDKNLNRELEEAKAHSAVEEEGSENNEF